MRARKKYKRISKKCLTKSKRCVMIENVPRQADVPCKLNNVRKKKAPDGSKVVRNHKIATKVVGE